MKITYIHHSSFSVELDGGQRPIVMLFDYFNGQLPEWDKDVSLYVFASHKHFDHFSKKIFNLALQYPDITFILSKETKMNEKYMDRCNIPQEARSRINYVTRNQQYDFGGLHVTTLTSTDSGVAFIVECQGKTLYHAGDLNWWIWPGKALSRPEKASSTPGKTISGPDALSRPKAVPGSEAAKQMEKAFKTEIDKYGKDFTVDAAFLPLDIRQEDGFYKGFDYYMKRWNIVKAFPMHCWGRFDAIDMLLAMETSEEYRDRIVNITKDGESWQIV